MLRTKKDVDKHVQDLLRKISSDQERNLRGYSVAKLYHQIGENQIAKQYVTGYLSVKEASAPGHRLLGQIVEALGDKEAAIRAYRNSLDLDNNQRDLVLKICQLLCELPVTSASLDRERFWLDYAEKLHLQHSSVFALRQRYLVSSKESGGDDMELLLTSQMVSQPTDSKLRIQLLKMYLEQNRFEDAYDHASKVEARRPFPDDVTWYNSLLDVYDAYKANNKSLNADFYRNFLAGLERLTFIQLKKAARQPNTRNDVVATLLRLDRSLYEAASDKAQDEAVINHFRGQLYFFMGLLHLLKSGGSRENTAVPAALFAAAYSQPLAQPKPGQNESCRSHFTFLATDGTYRKSQAGHFLLALERLTSRKTAVDNIRKHDNPSGKKQVFTAVFGANPKDQENSDFMDHFSVPSAEVALPSFEDLASFDAHSLSAHMESLHEITWIGLRYLEHYGESFAVKFHHLLKQWTCYDDLPFAVSSWNSSAPETLCFLDIEASLLSVAYCAAKQEQLRHSAAYDKKESVLPSLLATEFRSEQQTAFWDAVHKLVTNRCRENFGESRRIIQRGLEVVRLTGNNHGVPRELVAKLARSFAFLASQGRTYPAVDLAAPISTHEFTLHQIEALESQAYRYWKAYDSVDRHPRILAIPQAKFFDYPVDQETTENATDESKLYQGYYIMRQGKREEALRQLQHQGSPYASYYTGLIYRDMAEDQARKEHTDSDVVSSLLSKAKDAFYLTLDRLRSPSVDRHHPLNQKLATVIEDIESRIAVSLEDVTKNGAVSEEENEEFRTPTNILPQSASTPMVRARQPLPSATPAMSRIEARPSPERLDAQQRQMALRQESFNQAISNEVQKIREDVTAIKSMVVELRELLQQQQQSRKARVAKTSESYSEYYEDQEEGDWDEEEEEEEEEEAPPPAATRKGKLKSVAHAPHPPVAAPASYPPFSLPFPAHGYLPNFPPNYAQFPGFNPYMLHGMGPQSPFAANPYAAAPHFAPSPAPPAPAPPAVATTPAPAAIPAPAAVTPATPGNVFSRLGPKPTPPQQVTTTTPALPQNVVITSSDTLPKVTTPVTSAPQYAVTIPPQHRAGAPHAFQISLPATSVLSPEKKTQEAEKLVPAIPLTTQGLLASIPQPTYSSVTTPDKQSPIKSPVRTSTRRISTCSEGSAAEEEEHDAMPDFKPIIPLPEEVEVKTGEEGETILFEQRAKLFRFVGKEWKERGVGTLKILHDESTDRVRIIMRRDQVFKICANHYLTPDIELKRMETSPNAWIWAAPDFADGESCLEKFCARFKTPEQSEEFAQAFAKGKTIAKTPISSSASAAAPKPAGGQPPTTVETKAAVSASTAPAATPSGFGDKFKPKVGSWTCDTCYVTNEAGKVVCASCETPKPGAVVPTTTAAQPAATSGFKFGIPSATSAAAAQPSAGSGFKFGIPTPATTAPVAAAAATSAATQPSAPSGFKFGVPAPSTAAPVPAAATQPSPAIGIKFGVAATSAAATTAPSAFKFTSPTSSATPAAAAAPSPVRFTLPAATTAETSSATSTPASFTFAMPAASSAASSTTATPSKSLFSFSLPGAQSATPSKSIFGGSAQEVSKTEEKPKPSFGGFTFSTKPVISETPKVTEEPKKEEEKTKPSPFAGFSFGASVPAAGKPQPSAFTGPLFGGTTNNETQSSGMLFSSLAQQVGGKGFAADKDFKGFAGVGQPVFASPQKKEADEDKDNEEKEEEFEPTVEFQPVVPLPALVEVKTGEEDEKVLFSDRAILYRYVDKEWKERGRGDFKILEHKTSGRVRFLMRREQVHKICCNHAITAELKIEPLQTSDRTWTWYANDFSEGELVKETFALKFKTSEQAKKFKTVFDEAQKGLKEKPAAAHEGKKTVESTVKVKPLSELFKPQQGSWECQGCFIRNPVDVVRCPACETIKPGSEGAAAATSSAPAAAATPVSAFKFGIPSSSATGIKEALKPAGSGPFSLLPSGGTGGFQFGTPSGATPAASTQPSVPFSLGTPASTSGSGFSFVSSAGSGAFTFSMAVTASAIASSPEKPGRSPHVSFSSDNEYYEDDGSGDHIHFTPVVPLPEKVEVKTGEEDEEVLYCHRAKLLRFADGEWKERGTGDIKILKHTATGKVRFLMRREQILKVCLNHALTNSLKFVPKDERSWLWAAQDFAEAEPSFEKFVIRFRNAEVAKEFMEAVNNAVGGTTEAKSAKADDVNVVYEKKVSDELRRKAEELKLPPNFFLYEEAPPCPGCRGCIDDTDTFQVREKESSKADTSVTSAPSENLFSSWAAKADSSLSFASLASVQSAGFNKPSNFSWAGAGQPVFGGLSAAAAPKTTATQEAEEEGEDETEEVENTHDPHFEPIVPLPALVDVKTGEEDEEVIFCHRAKLYRFDASTKEWKERGVGDLKILFHREKNTYRILLRREQIHKLACNHWLTGDMALTAMSTSNNSWLWAAMDYTEGELVAEKFAAKFKYEETAKEFKKKFDECTAALRNETARPSTSTIAAAPTTTPIAAMPAQVAEEKEEEEEEEEGGEEEGEDEDNDEDYEDVQESVMFQDRCTLSALNKGTWILLGTGTLKIIYDDDMLCARMVMEPDVGEHFLCDNVIAIETELKVEGRECIWSALDYSQENEPVKRTFRAQFATTDIALGFSGIFHEGKEIAENSEVHDVPDLSHNSGGHSGESSSEASAAAAAPAPLNIKACDEQLAEALSDIVKEILEQ